MENLDSSIKKNGFSNGLLLGVALFIVNVIAFYIFISSTAPMTIILVPLFFTILIPLGISIFLTLDLRKKIGGFWTFRQATTGIFVMFFMAFVVQYVTRDLIFAKVIEPEMTTKMQTAVVNLTTAMMEKTGVDQTKIDAKIDEIQHQFETQQQVGLVKTLQGFVTAIIFTFVLALIFGVIFKRERPLSPYDIAAQAEDPADPTV